jgi:hypothetical protein
LRAIRWVGCQVFGIYSVHLLMVRPPPFGNDRVRGLLQ